MAAQLDRLRVLAGTGFLLFILGANGGPYVEASSSQPACARRIRPPSQLVTGENGTGEPCDVFTDGGGWIIFQRRTSPQVDFHRSWDAYKQGFGDMDGDFWWGNDRLHQSTIHGTYELRVDLTFQGKTHFAHYDEFSVGPENDTYRLYLGAFSGTAGDSLGVHNGMGFTTLDQDNDEWAMNCARTFHGGWWYRNCHLSNLNGEWSGKNSTTGLHWSSLTGPEGSVEFSEMKFRRVYTSCTDVSGHARQVVVLDDGTEVLCDTETEGGGWLVIQRRTSSNMDFDRGWTEYKEGFGDLETNFWFGNQKIHQITSSDSYELRVDLVYEGKAYSNHYSLFSLSDENEGYKIHLRHLALNSGAAPENLLYHNGMAFTTKDKDHDKMDSYNCAKLFHGAWWYNNCHASNLNGKWASKEYGKGLTWRNITSYFGSVELSEMKIRPRPSKFVESCIDVVGSPRQIALLKLGARGVEILCDTETDGGGWLVIQRRADSATNFDRTWEEYKHGFGSLGGSFWFGNGKVHEITSGSTSYQLRVDLVYKGQRYFALYNSFSIGNEQNGFKLYVTDYDYYASNASDSLSMLQERSFTTKDRDHDYRPNLNCADKYGFGWWYDQCLHVAQRGVWWEWESHNKAGFYWTGLSEDEPVEVSELKIRPN